MPFGRKLLARDAGGSEEEYEDTKVERDDEVDLSDGDEADADDEIYEEEEAEQDAGTYAFIHSVKRNILKTMTSDKLVYIHANIRSSAERNWSTYSFIHSVKRNKLNTKTAHKLVYIIKTKK
jgi:hypothetical protein